MKHDLFLLFLFDDMRPVSCNGDLFKLPKFCLNPTSEGLVNISPTTGHPYSCEAQGCHWWMSLAMKQFQGPLTNKQIWGNYFMTS